MLSERQQRVSNCVQFRELNAIPGALIDEGDDYFDRKHSQTHAHMAKHTHTHVYDDDTHARSVDRAILCSRFDETCRFEHLRM